MCSGFGNVWVVGDAQAAFQAVFGERKIDGAVHFVFDQALDELHAGPGLMRSITAATLARAVLAPEKLDHLSLGHGLNFPSDTNRAVRVFQSAVLHGIGQ